MRSTFEFESNTPSWATNNRLADHFQTICYNAIAQIVIEFLFLFLISMFVHHFCIAATSVWLMMIFHRLYRSHSLLVVHSPVASIDIAINVLPLLCTLLCARLWIGCWQKTHSNHSKNLPHTRRNGIENAEWNVISNLYNKQHQSEPNTQWVPPIVIHCLEFFYVEILVNRRTYQFRK